MSETQGQRLPDEPASIFSAPNGSYWRKDSGEWMVRDPVGNFGRLGKHDVEEHEDGTITVSPSILISNPQHDNDWHGFLERGVWREV